MVNLHPTDKAVRISGNPEDLPENQKLAANLPNRLRAADLQYLEAADTEFAQVLQTFAEHQVRLQHKFPSMLQGYPLTH